MERNELFSEKYLQEVEKREKLFFGYEDEEYMTQEVNDWNQKFMDEYIRLKNWRSEDGTMMYTEDYIAEALGFRSGGYDRYGIHTFVNRVRAQMRAYTLKRFKALYEAGKSAGEIADDMNKTEKWVEMMVERYYN